MCKLPLLPFGLEVFVSPPDETSLLGVELKDGASKDMNKQVFLILFNKKGLMHYNSNSSLMLKLERMRYLNI